MSSNTLEQRVVALEEKIADLTARIISSSGAKDWRSTIGMFAGDSLMQEIDEAGRQIREADREQAFRDHS